MQLAEASKLVEEWSSQPQCFDLWGHAATPIYNGFGHRPWGKQAILSWTRTAGHDLFTFSLLRTILSSFGYFWFPRLACLVDFSGKHRQKLSCLHDALGPPGPLRRARSEKRQEESKEIVRYLDLPATQGELIGVSFFASLLWSICSLFFATSLY